MVVTLHQPADSCSQPSQEVIMRKYKGQPRKYVLVRGTSFNDVPIDLILAAVWERKEVIF